MALRAVPSGYSDFSQGRVRLLARTDLAEILCARGALAGTPPATWGEVVARVGGGRRPLMVVRVSPFPELLLVKEIRRGGWLGPLLGGAAGTNRAFAEVLVVETLRQAGVACPPVLAARATRHFGLEPLARVEIVTPFVAGGLNLLEWLRADPAPTTRRRVLEAAGGVVWAMHGAGVIHEDLNLGNLLVEPGGDVSILDLGNSSVQPASARLRAANLARLYRSAVKRKLAPGRLSTADAARLVRAYRPDGWKDVFRAARRSFRATLPFHRLSWLLGG